MDFGKKPSLVLYLERNRFDLYSESQNRVYNFDLAPFVSNLEIKDKETLYSQIISFVTTNSIPTGGMVIILAESILFIKAMPPVKSVEEEDNEVQKFSDSVPFDHVELKAYPIESGKLLVAANKDYYTSIKASFEKCGFLTSIVAPIYSTGVTIDPASGLSVENGRGILKSIDNLRVSSLEMIEETVGKASTTVQQPQKPNRSRLYILSGVFGLLILLLVVVIFNSSSSTPPPTATPKVNTAISPVVSITSAPIASTSASLDPANIRISVAGSATTASQQQQVRQSLQSAGFGTISPSLEQRQTEVPLLVFSPDVPGEIRTQIAEVVSQYNSNFTVTEETSPDYDILIYLR